MDGIGKQMGQIITKVLKNYSIIFLILLIIFTSFTIIKVESSVTSIPIIIESSIKPTKAQPGDLLTASISVADIFGVKSVKARFFHEHGSDVVNLSLVSGTIFRGVWEGQWIVHDTLIKEYWTLISVVSKSGGFSSVNLNWFDPAPWWDIGWTYRKEITLNHSQVPNDLTNFPIVVSITDSDLKVKAQSDADDILFTDSNGNKLNHEIEEYDSSTGKLIAWVDIPSLSSTSDTKIFMYYGNKTCSNQQNPNNVWNSNYVGVWHLNEISTGPRFDSTINNNTGTPQNYDGDEATTGKIGGADYFDGNNDRISIVDSTSLSFTNDVLTIEAWVKVYSLPSSEASIVRKENQWAMQFLNTNTIRNLVRTSGINGWTTANDASYSFSTGTWYYWTFIYNGANVVHKINAQQVGTPKQVTGNIIDNSNPVYIGYCINTDRYIYGVIDEIRISKTARSNDWITTSYNNQNNASNGGFFIIGEEEIAVPTKPNLLFPGNNTALNYTRPIFQWNNNSENHENYTLYVSKKYDFSEEHINISLNSSTSTYNTTDEKALSEGLWYWKVVANNSQKTNSSEIWSFIVDITPPLSVNLNSPANDYVSDSNTVIFTWYQTTDNTTNTSEVSNVKCYQLQVDDSQDFSSPLVDENTSNNATLSLTEIVTGKLYWRVCAWDNAGNSGNWSETRTFTIFSYSLSTDSPTIQIKRGGIESIVLSVNYIFGDAENISLISQWSGDNQPNSINVSFSIQEALIPFESIITFICGESSSTGTFICTINATSKSGINRSIDIEVTVYSMLFSLDVFPRSLSFIRSDQDTATVSVSFDQGILGSVNLTGDWIGSTPSGISIVFNPSSGTPDFDSTVTFTTSSSATAGSFVYRVTGTSSGLSKKANIYIDISKNLSITVTTDKQIYEKGQNIKISGTAKDPKNNPVNSGIATINFSAQNWSHTIITSIANGIYNTSYYISFDKPVGDWNISVTATDNKGNEILSPEKTAIFVESPEIYEQYSINILNPTTGQVFKRGEIITFTISIVNLNKERVQGAEVKVYLESNEIVVFSEDSPGIYTSSYELGYDFTLGASKIYVEGKKYEDEKLKMGFNFIDFKVSTVTFVVKLIEIKPDDIIEVGETINIKLEALYPNGSPVENSVIKAVGPNGIEILFSKSKSERGMYTACYIPAEGDIGNWVINVDAEDAYGNYYKGEIINIEIVHIKTLSYLLRYWWITALAIIIMASFTSYIGCKKLDRIKIRKLKDEILELKKLKEKNAIFYYSDYSIDRETYENLSKVYESKIANLSKKLRLLEKKFENKKGKKK